MNKKELLINFSSTELRTELKRRDDLSLDIFVDDLKDNLLDLEMTEREDAMSEINNIIQNY